ncbi:SprT-like domain-containing protein [Micromonospora sp. NPDC092111]|uniref:SprT-like domain-containing protein n=1 Tax=Micromonospora sp. NPDC092111 TaxID=3364289 RepID=UPI0038041A96
MRNLQAVTDTYNGLNALCFGGRLRPCLIRLAPSIVNEHGQRLAGAWNQEDWSIGIDSALLDYPRLLVGTLLHEMTHQECWQQDRIAGHGPFFVAAASRVAALLDIPAPTSNTASTWPYPVPRQLLKEF